MIEMGIMSKSETLVGMGLVEAETTHGLGQMVKGLLHQEIVIAMETNLLIEAEGGEKRTGTIELEIGETAMTEAIGDGIETGTETRDKNAILSGWMNQRMEEIKPTPRKSFKSGKSKCKGRTNLVVAKPLRKKRRMEEDSLV